MKDFLDKKLEIGDKVVFIEKGCRNFKRGTVVDFKPKSVVVQKEAGGRDMQSLPYLLMKI